MATLKAKTIDGDTVEFCDDRLAGSGTMKDVYFSPDGNYVAAFFRKLPDQVSLDRLEMITGSYREQIFEGSNGRYWADVYCWPQKIIRHEGQIGIVVPSYDECFFFKYGSKNNDFLKIKGKEKQGKWFASANNRFRFLDDREIGDWRSTLEIMVNIARGVRRLHAAGLAHSDLSYKNILVSPSEGRAAIIDLDGLVVPGKYPPDVTGTPDFIAPEVVETSHLTQYDENKKLPNIFTDRHALAVLVYQYLFLRHPLRGRKVHDVDPQKDEGLTMGRNALFVEHPTDSSNGIDFLNARDSERRWYNTSALPYKIAGPYLTKLFEHSFLEGLHAPSSRPTADDWEVALTNTLDLLVPCGNNQCSEKWFVYDNSLSPSCPFCKAKLHHDLVILNFYSPRAPQKYVSDNHRLVAYDGSKLYEWHKNRFIQPNEKIANDKRMPLANITFVDGAFHLENIGMPALKVVEADEEVPIGTKIELTNGLKLLTGFEPGDRLVHIQLFA